MVDLLHDDIVLEKKVTKLHTYIHIPHHILGLNRYLSGIGSWRESSQGDQGDRVTSGRATCQKKDKIGREILETHRRVVVSHVCISP